MVIPFLNCDTVGSEWIDREVVRTTGETVHGCKDKTNNALLHETPRQIPNRLFTKPCANVHTRILSQLDRDTGRKNKQLLV